MNDHAYLPPSAAHTWSKCAQWASMNARYPQPASAEADEGTAAHWVAWEILEGRPRNKGDKAPNGQIVTDEMLDGGDLIVDLIRKRIQIFGMNPVIEQPINVPFGTGNFGTPDVWAVSSDYRHIEIIDYKFGHRFVDEYFNPQGLCYLAGIVDQLSDQLKVGWSILEQSLTVAFTVVQPRCFYKGEPVRTHSFKLSEVRPYFNQLANMAEAATVAEPIATTNPHCGDCPGRQACSALQEAAYSDAEFATSRTPLDLSPAAAGLELKLLQRALERLEARVEGLKELTIVNLRSGKQVPYFHLEQGRGRAQWNVPDGQVIEIGKLFGKDLSKPGLITPSQAIKAGIDESVIKGYSSSQSTSFKLIADDPADARKVFGSTQEGK
jgi:hypothetical protein